MSKLVKLASCDEVQEGEPVSVRISGHPQLAVYRIGDNFFVTDDKCTHGSALLSDGYQEGDIIECPFHGGAFNIKDGIPSQFPCTEAIRSYETFISDDHVCIQIEP